MATSKGSTMESRGGGPRAVFMAFGTQGDVYPIAAIAAALAGDQRRYNVILITHTSHKMLGEFLEARRVCFVPISTPPTLSFGDVNAGNGDVVKKQHRFGLWKSAIQMEHRKECMSAIERIFGHGPKMESDFMLINFFALEGWSLAELFQVRCVVAAPYVVPYSAPASFERRFKHELPLLYNYLQEAPMNRVCWNDVFHWMWPLFLEDWGTWRHEYLRLSPFPFTDPVTCQPLWHMREQSPLLLYGFSKEVVECPGYWPSNIHVCGFWFLPMDWQFSCTGCRERSLKSFYLHIDKPNELCSDHTIMQNFMGNPSTSSSPIFVGLSSAGSMGFIKNPRAFLLVLKAVMEKTGYRFVLFSSSYEPLDTAIKLIVETSSNPVETNLINDSGDCTLLFGNRLCCFSGTMPYRWLFPKCAAVIHHGGSGSTAAAIQAGVPQVVCPFILDQFYWAERMHWLGLAPEPLHGSNLVPEDDDAVTVRDASDALVKAIRTALLPGVGARASEMAERISSEDGIETALRVLKEEVIHP